jgi:hypothetical protein
LTSGALARKVARLSPSRPEARMTHTATPLALPVPEIAARA